MFERVVQLAAHRVPQLSKLTAGWLHAIYMPVMSSASPRFTTRCEGYYTAGDVPRGESEKGQDRRGEIRSEEKVHAWGGGNTESRG